MDSAADFYPHNVDGRYLSPQPPVLAVSIGIIFFFERR